MLTVCFSSFMILATLVLQLNLLCISLDTTAESFEK